MSAIFKIAKILENDHFTRICVPFFKLLSIKGKRKYRHDLTVREIFILIRKIVKIIQPLLIYSKSKTGLEVYTIFWLFFQYYLALRQERLEMDTTKSYMLLMPDFYPATTVERYATHSTHII